MDRILRPYAPQPTPSPIGPAPAAHAHAATAQSGPKLVKTSSDLVKALKRRAWVVLGVALLVGVPGATFVARQPSIYRATASITIEPPRFDETVQSLLTHGRMAGSSTETADRYVPNQVAVLRGKFLAETVANSTSLTLSPGGDPASEIISGLTTRQNPGTSYFEVFLENRDPERAQKLLKGVLEAFSKLARNESRKVIDESEGNAKKGATQLKSQIDDIDRAIVDLFRQQQTPLFGPGGTNIIEQKYVALSSILHQKRIQADEHAQEERMARLYPNLQQQPGSGGARERRIADLMEEKERLTKIAMQYRKTIKNFDNDPSSKRIAQHLQETMNSLEQIQAGGGDGSNPAADMLGDLRAHASEEVQKLEEDIKGLLEQQHESMPRYQQYLTLLRERESKENSLATTQERIQEFRIVADTRKDPVKVLNWPSIPTTRRGRIGR